MLAYAEGAAAGAAAVIRWFSEAAGWRLWLALFVAGALSSLAMPPAFLWPILLLSFPALFAAVRPEAVGGGRPIATTVRARRGFAAAWWFGFGYHLAGLYWVGGAFLVQADAYAWLMPFAVTLMPGGLAIFLGIGGAIAALVPSRLLHPVATFALAVATVEYLRGTVLTGFPWNVFGYALTGGDMLIQLAGLFGIYGLTLIAVLGATVPGLVLLRVLHGSWHAPRRVAAILAGAFASCAIAAGIYGSAQLASTHPPLPGPTIRVVQPSIPQADKWKREAQFPIFEQHLRLSRRNPDGEPDDLDGIGLVVWPEAAMPFGPLASPEALARIADLLPKGTVLLAGLLRLDAGDAAQNSSGAQVAQQARVFNSAAAFDDHAKPVSIYDKVHLVPFGEYLPVPWLLESVGLEAVVRQRGGFARGPWPRPLLMLPGMPPIEVLICYEVVFPAEIARSKIRPGLLINLTNDGWFGRTSGPHQHFHQARVRAVETGLPMLRVANNGISAVIDARGRVMQSLALDATGVIDSAVPGAASEPLYARFGDRIFVILCLLVGLAGVVVARARPVNRMPDPS